MTDINEMPSCDRTPWDIASWMVRHVPAHQLMHPFVEVDLKKVKKELELHHVEAGVLSEKKKQLEKLCSKLAVDILKDYIGDAELNELLKGVGAHPATRVSAVREALAHVGTGYEVHHTRRPQDWFERYRKAEIERSAPTRVAPEVRFLEPALTPIALREEVVA